MAADRDRMRPEIYTSPKTAARVGNDAVNANRADAFHVKPLRKRNPDKSIDLGWIAVLFKAGRPVGFA
jgi:hypothetical protein